MNRLAFHLEHAPIPPLTAQSKRCLQNLVAYRPPRPRIPFPRSRSAAVLVALFVGRHGDIYVLLSRRSQNLRMYPGDTSLPGGRTDPEDGNMEDTARREAFEEIGLPNDKQKVPLLCIVDPFVASNGTIVTPVVVLILDYTLRPILNDAEVTTLFSHPLASFLTTAPPFPTESETLEVPYYSSVDWDLPGPNRTIWRLRTHRFLTGREAGGVKPVVGITASILIHVSTIGYARPPEFEVDPPGTPSYQVRMAWILLSNPEYREACEREGLKVDWRYLKKLARVDDHAQRRCLEKTADSERYSKKTESCRTSKL